MIGATPGRQVWAWDLCVTIRFGYYTFPYTAHPRQGAGAIAAVLLENALRKLEILSVRKLD